MSQTLRYAFCTSKIGKILVAQSDKGICAILIADDEAGLVEELQQRFPTMDYRLDKKALADSLAEVKLMAEAKIKKLSTNLDIIHGTPFQKRVWQALRKIPSGKTATYTEIANAIAAPTAARAVAKACGANPISIAIPCHRVIRQDGALSGYYWGVARKQQLLDFEANS